MERKGEAIVAELKASAEQLDDDDADSRITEESSQKEFTFMQESVVQMPLP